MKLIIVLIFHEYDLRGGFVYMLIPFRYRPDYYQIDLETGRVYHKASDGVKVSLKAVGAKRTDRADLCYSVAYHKHDHVIDTAANLLGMTKFADFDPRFNEIQVDSTDQDQPLEQRLSMTRSEQPLISPLARQLLIDLYARRDTKRLAKQLPKPFGNFMVYPDNTVIGTYMQPVDSQSSRSLAFRQYRYLVYYANAANLPERASCTGWQWLSYYDYQADVRYTVPMPRKLLSHLYDDVANHGGAEFKKHCHKYTHQADYWTYQNRQRFFAVDDQQDDSDDRADERVHCVKVKSIRKLSSGKKYQLKKKRAKSFVMTDKQLNQVDQIMLAEADDPDVQFAYRVVFEFLHDRIKARVYLTRKVFDVLKLKSVIKK